MSSCATSTAAKRSKFLHGLCGSNLVLHLKERLSFIHFIHNLPFSFGFGIPSTKQPAQDHLPPHKHLPTSTAPYKPSLPPAPPFSSLPPPQTAQPNTRAQQFTRVLAAQGLQGEFQNLPKPQAQLPAFKQVTCQPYFSSPAPSHLCPKEGAAFAVGFKAQCCCLEMLRMQCCLEMIRNSTDVPAATGGEPASLRQGQSLEDTAAGRALLSGGCRLLQLLLAPWLVAVTPAAVLPLTFAEKALGADRSMKSLWGTPKGFCGV